MPSESKVDPAAAAAEAAGEAAGVGPSQRHFPPTRAAAEARLDALRPAAYARSRNALDGAVTGLSPYFTHGLIGPDEALARLIGRHRLGHEDKLVFEFGWRAFFHHAWAHAGDDGDGILRTLSPEGLPWAGRRAEAVPEDVLAACSGVPAIDTAVRLLHATGYLHNHARMWLASYLVHVRRVHWRPAADWLYGHLLDGDLACNHLSWQWVAGSFSSKPYFFNAANVERHAPAGAAAGAWRSPGTAIDRSYEALEEAARRGQDAGPERRRPEGLSPPPLLAAPPPEAAAGLIGPEPATALQAWAAFRAARPGSPATVEWVQPWDLGGPDEGLPAGPRPWRLGLLHAPAHARLPWSARRWDFVLRRMQAVCDAVWFGDGEALRRALAERAALSATATRQPGYRELLARLPRGSLRPPPRAFADPPERCASFSRWYARSRQIEPDLAAGLMRARHAAPPRPGTLGA